MFVCFPSTNNYLSYVYEVLTLVYRVIRWMVTNISQKGTASTGCEVPRAVNIYMVVYWPIKNSNSLIDCVVSYRGETRDKLYISSVWKREVKKRRTGSRTPATSVSSSVLGITNSVLDSGNQSSSRHICGFAHSLKANILFIPAPLTTQTHIHTECYAEAAKTNTVTTNE